MISGVPLIFNRGLLGNLEEPILAGIIIIVLEKSNLKAPLHFFNKKILIKYKLLDFKIFILEEY
jgi:hypothetical protein